MAEIKRKSEWIVKYCLAQLGRPYWRGTWGQHASDALLTRMRKKFPESYTASDFAKQAKQGQKVHDCCGLLKGAVMCKTVNGDPEGELKPVDKNPTMLYDAASVKSDDMSKFPMKKAYLVYNSNKSHVGVYTGDGEVTEARGHAYGVVKSKITDARWKYWSDYCHADYSDQEPTPAPVKEDEVKYDELQICRKGSTGDAVKTIQANVKVTVDGVFGTNTEIAVKKFQKDHGLTQDGIVGQRTWKAIIERWHK